VAHLLAHPVRWSGTLSRAVYLISLAVHILLQSPAPAVQPPTYADNVTLPAFVRRCRTNPSIYPARRAHSSKRAVVDRQTDRQTVTVPHHHRSYPAWHMQNGVEESWNVTSQALSRGYALYNSTHALTHSVGCCQQIYMAPLPLSSVKRRHIYGWAKSENLPTRKNYSMYTLTTWY